MTKILIPLFILSLSTACIKTADQVQRERRFDNMTEQIQDSQSLVADMVAQMKDLQAQLDKLNGRLEEMEHRQGKINPITVNNMNENLTLLQGQREVDSAQLTQIQHELKEQRSFLEKVAASLASMGQQSKPKKKSIKDELNDALELVKGNHYQKAKSELLGLVDNKELSPGENNKVLHGLGRVEFYTKGYDKALVYFSKIYSKYPKSSLAPSALLFIGRSFKKLGKKDEGNEAFTKLIEDYPASKEASEAKKEL